MKEITFIEQMLKVTSVLVREKYLQRSQIEVGTKSEANDLVTEVDLVVQDYIVEQIAHLFPDDIIAAEERGLANIPQDPDARCWVIDPIDGTQNLVRGLFPAFGISVAFAQGGRPVAGGVAVPMSREIFLAERGAGAWRDGKTLRVSEVASVAVSRVEIDFSGRSQRSEILERTSNVIRNAGQIRCNCATVVALCSIAAAEMEGFVHAGLNPWDYAAGQVIVEEAGGKATRLDGSPLALFDSGRGVAMSNGLIHDELIGLIG
jgi:myo-inositol-1(or 4)-monophosphatase